MPRFTTLLTCHGTNPINFALRSDRRLCPLTTSEPARYFLFYYYHNYDVTRSLPVATIKTWGPLIPKGGSDTVGT